MFDSRQTKAEIIEGGMKLYAAYVEKCAENERLRAALKEVVEIDHYPDATIARKTLDIWDDPALRSLVPRIPHPQRL